MPGLWSARRQDRALFVSQLFLVLGAALRLIEYLSNRPFSIDESFLALNLIEKTPGELLHQLDFKQAAPIGFLQIEWLASALFGDGQFALRLVPFLASLAALVLFYSAGKSFLPVAALPVACAAFALLDPVIYYAATVKQYELDVAAAVGLYALAGAFVSPAIGRRGFVTLALVGAVTVWFSHASAFVLAAIGLTLAYELLPRRDWPRLAGVAVVALVWSASLALELRLSRSNLSRIEAAFHGEGNVFLGTGKPAGSTWFDTATSKVRYLVGLEDTATGFPILGSLPDIVNQLLVLLVSALVLVGFLSLLKRRREVGLLLGIPPVLVLVTSAFHKYPLVGRTLLFLLPAVALCLGEGARVLADGKRWRVAGAAVAAACLVAIALLPAIHVVQQRASEGIRPALGDLGENARPGDTLYVGQLAQYGVVYYHRCKCAPFDAARNWPFEVTGGPSGAAPAMIPKTPRLVLGAVNLPQGHFEGDVRKLAGRGRVWILVSEIQEDKLRPFLDALRDEGRELQEFGPYGVRGTAASLYLFDLSEAS